MTEVVERVARVIYTEMAMVSGSVQAEWENGSDECKNVSLMLAESAINALIEPNMTMLNAAVDATGAGSDMSWSNRSPQSMFETGYRAMLAAAVREVGDG